MIRVLNSGVEFPGTQRGFRPVNLLEEASQPADEPSLRVKPFEIRTLRLKMK